MGVGTVVGGDVGVEVGAAVGGETVGSATGGGVVGGADGGRVDGGGVGGWVVGGGVGGSHVAHEPSMASSYEAQVCVSVPLPGGQLLQVLGQQRRASAPYPLLQQ